MSTRLSMNLSYFLPEYVQSYAHQAWTPHSNVSRVHQKRSYSFKFIPDQIPETERGTSKIRKEMINEDHFRSLPRLFAKKIGRDCMLRRGTRDLPSSSTPSSKVISQNVYFVGVA